MEFEIDNVINMEFARLEPHEVKHAREHIGPHFPVSLPVEELATFEDAFRRKAHQAEAALEALREARILSADTQRTFYLRRMSSIFLGSLVDISEYRIERRRQAFAEMGEEDPDNAS